MVSAPGIPASLSPNTMLEVRDLTVRYPSPRGGEVRAVEGVTFSIGAGEAVGLLGESGCGKTSVALSLLRLPPAAGCTVRGEVRFKGSDLRCLDERELEKIRGAEISLIFQEPSLALNPVMRVGDQIGEVLRAHQSWGRRRRRSEVLSLLEQVRFEGAGGVYDVFPHELSGGQRQRVLIAQALACRPALVVADEPTTGLDSRTQAEILALLRDLKSRMRTSFLFISHHPGVLAGLADRLMVMYAGKIVEEGPLGETYANPLHPYTQGLIRSMPGKPADGATKRRTRLHTIAGAPADTAERFAGCAFSARCPDRVECCDSREPVEILFGARRVRCFKYEN